MPPIDNLDFLSAENQRILNATRFDADRFWPVPYQCPNRILMVTDGSLDFSASDGFGLGTFASIIMDMGRPSRNVVTLAHMGSIGDMLAGDARVKNRIMSFQFDDPDHFEPDMYDVVFLFGFSTTFRERDSSHDGPQLLDSELQALTTFMNNGGGLFATGDHGALGKAMSHKIPRASKMRLWQSTSSDNDLDEVSMFGERRNDTNRRGDGGTQFADQSDDIPQDIFPKLYQRNTFIFRYSFPHPLLCGPNGPIRVMPDHPHEGECIEPTSVNETINVGVAMGPEFPASTVGGARPLPEIISTNTVPGGNTADGRFGGDKDPTIPHSFGGISAYDGHRANVGRVVTDATWHHFVNINLVGDAGEPAGSVKSLGFLASPQGQAHFEEIKTYYRNLTLWLTRSSIIRCMNHGWVFEIVRKTRVIEAIVTISDLRIEQASSLTLLHIGRHAKDALGKVAGQCETRRFQQWLLDMLLPIPEFEFLAREFDPWEPEEAPSGENKSGGRELPGLGFTDLSAIPDIMLGAALVEANNAFDATREKLKGDELENALTKGAKRGGEIAMDAYRKNMEQLDRGVFKR